MCLSRACLGEKIAFKHEWVKADRFFSPIPAGGR
eukprot:COSAG06_NODE_84888_length_100_cov_193.000000_1_plen_33_part_11